MRKSVAILIVVGLIIAIGLGEGYESALQEMSPANWKSKQITKYCSLPCTWIAEKTNIGGPVEEGGIQNCSQSTNPEWCEYNVKAVGRFAQIFGVF
jgi:hypothetical protein